MSISSSFTQLAVLANVAALTLYLMCVAASYELQRRDVRDEGAIPFAVPGGPVVPILAAAVIVWLLSTQRGASSESKRSCSRSPRFFISSAGPAASSEAPAHQRRGRRVCCAIASGDSPGRRSMGS